MDLETLEAFVEVARHGSFSAAAGSLQVSTTSISYRIQKLERSLDAQLFDRTTRSVRLTDLGTELLSKAVEILSISAEMQHLAAEQIDEPRGKLRITATTGLGQDLLGAWLIEFRNLYEKVDIELVCSNHRLDLQEHRFDFAIRQGPLPDSTLIARKLIDNPFGYYASPALLGKLPAIHHPNDLDALPCLSILAEGLGMAWTFEKDGERLQTIPSGAMGFEDVNMVLSSALAGIGIARLPVMMVTQAVRNGEIVPLLEDWWLSDAGLYLVYAQRDHLTSKERCFVQFILDKFSTLNRRLGVPAESVVLDRL